MRSPDFSPTVSAFNPPPKSEITSATRLRKCTSEVNIVLWIRTANRSPISDDLGVDLADLGAQLPQLGLYRGSHLHNRAREVRDSRLEGGMTRRCRRTL